MPAISSVVGVASGYDPTMRIEQYVTPLTGTTVTVNNNTQILLIDPAGTIAALTVTFPSTNLINGQEITVATSQIVTALTMNGGTILNALTSAAVGTFGTWRWNVTTSKWWRVD